jgi:hypothetical protein
MHGNIFISVPAADKTNSLPASIDRYDWEEFTYDEEGTVTSMTTIHPTWEQYGERYKNLFGAPVHVTVNEHMNTLCMRSKHRGYRVRYLLLSL